METDVRYLKERNFDPNSVEGEYDLVRLWGTIRPKRLIAGVLAGFTAGFAMFLFGVIVCMIKGLDILLPIKVAAIPFLGLDALYFGMTAAIPLGILFQMILGGFLGAVYAHFTGINNTKALAGMGLTWGIWGWIFIHNLMGKSVMAYRTADLHGGVMFFAWLAFGFALMSVAFFDRALNKN